MTFIVYMVTSPSGKRYVGITGKGLTKRRTNHQCDARRGSEYPLHAAIRKYGDVLEWKILEDGIESWAEATIAERKFIQAFQCQAPHGYNATAGGEGAFGYKHTSEARTTMSERRRGKRLSDETRNRMSASKKGVCPTGQRAAATARSRPVVDQHGTIYPSATAAAKQLGLHAGNIRRVLRGSHNHTGGYVFTFLTTTQEIN